MRRTRAFLALCLIGRYGLPVFATGTVLSAMGELVETRSEAFSHELAFGVAIVVGGLHLHYLVARGLAALRDKSVAQQSMMNRAHTLQMASPLSLRKSPIVLWSGTSRPVSHICPSRKSYPRVAVMQSGQDWCDDDRHRSLDVSWRAANLERVVSFTSPRQAHAFCQRLIRNLARSPWPAPVDCFLERPAEHENDEHQHNPDHDDLPLRNRASRAHARGHPDAGRRGEPVHVLAFLASDNHA